MPAWSVVLLLRRRRRRLFVVGMSLTLMIKGHHIDSEIATNKNMQRLGIKCAVHETREADGSAACSDSGGSLPGLHGQLRRLRHRPRRRNGPRTLIRPATSVARRTDGRSGLEHARPTRARSSASAPIRRDRFPDRSRYRPPRTEHFPAAPLLRNETAPMIRSRPERTEKPFNERAAPNFRPERPRHDVRAAARQRVHPFARQQNHGLCRSASL